MRAITRAFLGLVAHIQTKRLQRYILRRLSVRVRDGPRRWRRRLVINFERQSVCAQSTTRTHHASVATTRAARHGQRHETNTQALSRVNRPLPRRDGFHATRHRATARTDVTFAHGSSAHERPSHSRLVVDSFIRRARSSRTPHSRVSRARSRAFRRRSRVSRRGAAREAHGYDWRRRGRRRRAWHHRCVQSAAGAIRAHACARKAQRVGHAHEGAVAGGHGDDRVRDGVLLGHGEDVLAHPGRVHHRRGLHRRTHAESDV